MNQYNNKISPLITGADPLGTGGGQSGHASPPSWGKVPRIRSKQQTTMWPGFFGSAPERLNYYAPLIKWPILECFLRWARRDVFIPYRTGPELDSNNYFWNLRILEKIIQDHILISMTSCTNPLKLQKTSRLIHRSFFYHSFYCRIWSYIM